MVEHRKSLKPVQGANRALRRRIGLKGEFSSHYCLRSLCWLC
jgi:hypothetical protein